MALQLIGEMAGKVFSKKKFYIDTDNPDPDHLVVETILDPARHLEIVKHNQHEAENFRKFDGNDHRQVADIPLDKAQELCAEKGCELYSKEFYAWVYILLNTDSEWAAYKTVPANYQIKVPEDYR